eukprot:767189-Hanusia_phi.AAC.1
MNRRKESAREHRPSPEGAAEGGGGPADRWSKTTACKGDGRGGEAESRGGLDTRITWRRDCVE